MYGGQRNSTHSSSLLQEQFVGSVAAPCLLEQEESVIYCEKTKTAILVLFLFSVALCLYVLV